MFFIFVCKHVYICPPTPSPPFTRSETCLAQHLHIDIPNILILFFLYMCLTVLILSNINLNCRFISLNTPLNSLTPRSCKTKNQHFLLLFLSYFMIFEYYFIIFLPCEFFNINLDILRISYL